MIHSGALHTILIDTFRLMNEDTRLSDVYVTLHHHIFLLNFYTHEIIQTSGPQSHWFIHLFNPSFFDSFKRTPSIRACTLHSSARLAYVAFIIRYSSLITWTNNYLRLTQHPRSRKVWFVIDSPILMEALACNRRYRLQEGKKLFLLIAHSANIEQKWVSAFAFKEITLKGLSYEIDFENVDENWQILALTRAAAGFWIFQRHLWFLVEKNILFPVNAKITPKAYVIRLFLYLYSRQAFLTKVVSFYKQQSEAASVLCKPIGAKLWPISEHRENCKSLSACYLHISKYHLAHRRPNTVQDFMERAEPATTFFTWYQYYTDSE